MNSYSKPIRWGVIGCGQIAVDKSLPGLLAAQGAGLVATSDPLEARREMALELAQQHGAAPRACGDIHELLYPAAYETVKSHIRYVHLKGGVHYDANLPGIHKGSTMRDSERDFIGYVPLPEAAFPVEAIWAAIETRRL